MIFKGRVINRTQRNYQTPSYNVLGLLGKFWKLFIGIIFYFFYLDVDANALVNQNSLMKSDWHKLFDEDQV